MRPTRDDIFSPDHSRENKPRSASSASLFAAFLAGIRGGLLLLLLWCLCCFFSSCAPLFQFQFSDSALRLLLVVRGGFLRTVARSVPPCSSGCSSVFVVWGRLRYHLRVPANPGFCVLLVRWISLSAVDVAFDEVIGFDGLPSDGILLGSWNQVVHRLFSQICTSSFSDGLYDGCLGRWFFSSRPLLLLFHKLSVEVCEVKASRLLWRPNSVCFLGSNPFVGFVAVGSLWWWLGYGWSATPLCFWASVGVSFISRSFVLFSSAFRQVALTSSSVLLEVGACGFLCCSCLGSDNERSLSELL